MKRKKLLIILLPICLISFLLMACGEFYDFDHDNINDPQYPRGNLQGIARLQWGSDHSGIRVSLSEPGYTAITNMLGIFKITGIPAGQSYALTASKKGFNNATSLVAVSANEEIDLGVILLQSEFGRIAGVVKKEGADLHYGINVAILDDLSIDAITYIDGSYVISNVPPGPHILYASAPPPYYPVESPVPVDVIPGTTVTADDLELPTAPLSPIAEDAYPINSSAIAVTWRPNPEETQEIKGYNVHYRTATDIYYTMANPVSGEITSTTYTITGLTRGTQYYFKVTAVDNTDLESIYSQEEIYQFIYPQEVFSTPEISQENAIPGTPRDIALYADGTTTKIYVTTGDDQVYVIDPVTDTVNTTITADSFVTLTRGIAANPDLGEVYVADTSTELISVITVSTDTVIDTFGVGGNYNPVGILVYSSDDGDDDNDFIFVAYQGASGGLGDIRIFNAHTKALLKTLDNSPFGKYASGMVIANGKLYVANGNGTNVTGSVSVVECTKGSITSATTGSITSATITSSIKIGLQNRIFPTEMAVSADEEYVYVINNNTDPIGTVSVIDTDTDEVIKTLEVGRLPRGMTSVRDIVYVVSYGEVNIFAIDTRVNQVLSCSNYCDVRPGGWPSSIAATPDGNKLYVLNKESGFYYNNISVFDYNYNY